MLERQISEVKRQHYEPESSIPAYLNTNTIGNIKKQASYDEQPVGEWSTNQITTLLDCYAETGNKFNYLSQKLKQKLGIVDMIKYNFKNLQRKIYFLIKFGLIIFLKNLKNNPNLKSQFQALKHALKKTYPKKLMDSQHQLNIESKILLIRLNYCKTIPPASFEQLYEFIKAPKTPQTLNNQMYGSNPAMRIQVQSDDQQAVKQEKQYQDKQKQQKLRLIRQLRVCNKKLLRTRQPVFNQNIRTQQTKRAFQQTFMRYTRILQDAIKKTGKRYASRIQPKMFDFTFQIMYKSQHQCKDNEKEKLSVYKQISKKIFIRLDRLHNQKIFSKIDLIRLYRAIRGVYRAKQMEQKKLKKNLNAEKKKQQEQKTSQMIDKKFNQQLQHQRRGQKLKQVQDRSQDSQEGSSVGDSNQQSKSKSQGNNKKTLATQKKKIIQKTQNETKTPAAPKKNVIPYQLENLQNVKLRDLSWTLNEQQQLLQHYKNLGRYVNGLSSRMKLDFQDQLQYAKFEPTRLQIKLVSMIYRGLTILNQMNKVHGEKIKLSEICQRKISYLMASKIFDDTTIQNYQHVKQVLLDLSFRNKPQKIEQLQIVSKYIQKIIAKNAIERCQAIFCTSLLQNKNFIKINRLMIDTGNRLKMQTREQIKQKQEKARIQLLQKGNQKFNLKSYQTKQKSEMIAEYQDKTLRSDQQKINYKLTQEKQIEASQSQQQQQNDFDQKNKDQKGLNQAGSQQSGTRSLKNNNGK